MTPAEATELVAYLQAAYGGKDLPDATKGVYVEHLLDLDYGLAQTVVKRVVGEAKWFPSIAEIRAACLDATVDWPIPEEAWPLALRHAIDRVSVPEPVERAVAAMGRDSIRLSHVDDQRPREAFIRIYRAIYEKGLARRNYEARELAGGARPELRGLIAGIGELPEGT